MLTARYNQVLSPDGEGPLLDAVLEMYTEGMLPGSLYLVTEDLVSRKQPLHHMPLEAGTSHPLLCLNQARGHVGAVLRG